MITNQDEMYDSLCPEGIDDFWSFYNTVFKEGSKLHMNVDGLCADEKIEKAWDMLSYNPLIEDRLVSALDCY
ncbi:hypothetical protein [Vibrio barjaei]|uniref:hypothetical protein n=1 Tax=Vibrio barjaei TaxID=1676683 RepID=UPI002283A789|nr:hypothetical protein [Vibrio barjaei]MCY9872382.1 hypothetical protein [Vibrio barjaei]